MEAFNLLVSQRPRLLLVLLEVSGFLVAAVTDPHRVVPASGWHGPPPLGAVVADALATGAAVMDGKAGGELPLALAAAVDVLVRDPVSRASCVFHQAWMHRGWNKTVDWTCVLSSRNSLDLGAGSDAHPEVCRWHQLRLLACSGLPLRPSLLSGCLPPPLRQHPTALQRGKTASKKLRG